MASIRSALGQSLEIAMPKHFALFSILPIFLTANAHAQRPSLFLSFGVEIEGSSIPKWRTT